MALCACHLQTLASMSGHRFRHVGTCLPSLPICTLVLFPREFVAGTGLGMGRGVWEFEDRAWRVGAVRTGLPLWQSGCTVRGSRSAGKHWSHSRAGHRQAAHGGLACLLWALVSLRHIRRRSRVTGLLGGHQGWACAEVTEVSVGSSGHVSMATGIEEVGVCAGGPPTVCPGGPWPARRPCGEPVSQ